MIKREIKEYLEENFEREDVIEPFVIFMVKDTFERNNLEIGILRQYLQDNFEYILEHSKEVYEVIEEILKLDGMKEFIKNYLSDNFEKFVSFVPKEIIFESPSLYCKKNKIKLNAFLKNNKDDYVKYLLTSGILNLSDSESEKINEIVVMIVEEILEHEKKDYIDIERLKPGGYSNVIRIGSKVIKVGGKRETYQIPNTSILLQPLIRKDLSSISSFNGTIEVLENVETKVHFSDKQLEQIYKKARDEGVVLLDLKLDNIGILLKDNILHWDKSISNDMSTRGINGGVREVLKTGDIVLLDSDYIYTVDDYFERLRQNPLKSINEYEKRYMFEQQHSSLIGDSNEKVNLSNESKTSKTR